MKNYLDVEEGKNGWKRYLSTTILASAFMLLGSIIYIIADMVMVAADESGKSYFDFDSGVAVGINANLDFLLSHIVYMCWIFHFSREDPHLKERNGRSPASRWGMNRPFLIFFDF